MGFHRLEPGQARLLALAVKHDIPSRAEVWLEQLEQSRMTDEMRDIFEVLSYIPKRSRRSRKGAVDVDPLPSEETAQAILSAHAVSPIPDSLEVPDREDDLSDLPF